MVKKKHVPTLFMKYKSKKRELVEFPIIDQHTMLKHYQKFQKKNYFSLRIYCHPTLLCNRHKNRAIFCYSCQLYIHN